MNSEVKSQIKIKRAAFNKYYRRPTDKNWYEYTKARNISTRLTDNARINHENLICVNSKDNPKTFWKYVNSKNKKQNQLCGLKDSDGILKYDDDSKANLLNDYFTSVFIVDDDEPMIDSDINVSEYGIGSLYVTSKHILRLIDKLNCSKSAGPDGIHSKIIKECAYIFSIIFCIIFQKSMKDGVLPVQWKEGCVRALFKKGQKNVCSNYRPVSLTSVVCKLLESLIRDAILDYLESNNKIVLHQYGFRPGYSCSSQLLDVMEDFTRFMDLSLDFDCIYLDFAKAFDRVSHKYLVYKLSKIGIHGCILNWITDFLFDRKQRVKVNGFSSDWSDVTSGIPQGSVLGPILFTVFINDLPLSISSHVKIFADDTKVYNTIENTTLLQDDLDKLVEWSNRWLLPFNVDKCTVLHYGKKNINVDYSMNSNAITSNHCIRDLGILFQDDLKFSEHINKIVSSANSRLGIIRNTFHELSEHNFIVLYKSFVRPILEYCCTTWSPHLIMYHKEIEKIQRRATKLVKHFSKLSYSERLKRLNLTTLFYRRLRGDVIQVYRIINRIDKLDLDHYFEFNTRPSRHNSLRLLKPRALTSFRQFTFSHRVVNSWNELPDEVVLADSLNQFKNRLEYHWKHKEFKYETTFKYE